MCKQLFADKEGVERWVKRGVFPFRFFHVSRKQQGVSCRQSLLCKSKQKNVSFGERKSKRTVDLMGRTKGKPVRKPRNVVNPSMSSTSKANNFSKEEPGHGEPAAKVPRIDKAGGADTGESGENKGKVRAPGVQKPTTTRLSVEMDTSLAFPVLEDQAAVLNAVNPGSIGRQESAEKDNSSPTSTFVFGMPPTEAPSETSEGSGSSDKENQGDSQEINGNSTAFELGALAEAARAVEAMPQSAGRGRGRGRTQKGIGG